MSSYKIISVGGSVIVPQTGLDVAFLKKFRALILRHIKRGERFILIVGGGAVCRQYQQAAKRVTTSLTDQDLDWLGIHATVLNAHFVKYLFKDYADEQLIGNPRKKFLSPKPILVTGGYQPGHSTDVDAVLLAKTYGAKELINLSNIDHIYTVDPRLDPKAKKIEKIDWQTLRREIVGKKWTPGRNVPFDPIASREAERLGLMVCMVRGTALGEVEKVLKGKKFRGTIIG